MGIQSTKSENRILIVGPLPPPFGGSGVTVKVLLEELKKYPTIHVDIINTNPYSDPKKKMSGFRVEKIFRFIIVISKYLRRIGLSDIVLVFANPLFAFTIVPIMVLVAHVLHKSIYIKPVGGDLDIFIGSLPIFLKGLFLRVLKNADGIFAQTQFLQNYLIDCGCENAHYVPGFRSSLKIIRNEKLPSPELKIIFLAHLDREKGTLVFLHALQLLAKNPSISVHCDLFGLVHAEIEEEFYGILKSLTNAQYCGIAEAGSGGELIVNYDVLALPTFFECEGHPGVIIEAMQAGVPVISTYHRSIPELITDGENGILIPVRDSQALANAIEWAAQNREELSRMGQENKKRSEQFSSVLVVKKMLDIMFITDTAKEPDEKDV